MSKEFKRLAGSALNLRHDLFPRPSVQKYVRATLTDKNGASIGSGTVNLSTVGFGAFVDTSESMPSAELVTVEYQVFDDDQYTKPSCDYPGDTDTYELQTLLPSQLPGDATLEAEVLTVELEAEITSGQLESEVFSGQLDAEIETESVEASVESEELEAEAEQQEIEANKDC